MQVNPNQPYHGGKVTVSVPYEDSEIYKPGIPLKLELAAKFMAAMIHNGDYGNSWEEVCENAICAADTLITEYNNQQKEEE